ncbi:transcription-repair coupling factor [Listeria rocourtiae]|uniref:transcription-repair coupling factor n=1 Tax=Listeria rocourtiae TaxID=647910 RepID=UPI001625F820|nr:transcription-repair coupling factor [Listeria rocourtiae]MBC1436350.1 transcription-repair coupling factor [Listeria rocourtiae]
MKGLQQLVYEQKDIRGVIKELEDKGKSQLVTGLSGSSRALFASVIEGGTQRPVIFVTHNLYHAQKLYDDLSALLDSDRLYLYPADELISSELSISSPELRGQRVEVLQFLLSRKPGIVIVPVAGLRKILPPVSIWEKYNMSLIQGAEIDPEGLQSQLVTMGYSRSDMVNTPGEFSIRGGIIDIYPITEEHPIRLELFDTEVDSLRFFDVDSQRSIETVEEFKLVPATEILVEPAFFPDLVTRIEKKLVATLKQMSGDKEKQQLVENLEEDLELLRDGQKPDMFFKYIGMCYPDPASLLDYVSQNSILLFDEFARIQETDERLEKEEAEWQTETLERLETVRDTKMSHNFRALLETDRLSRIYLSLFQKTPNSVRIAKMTNIVYKQMQQFHGQMNVLKTEMDSWSKNNYAVVILAPSIERAEKMKQTLADYEMESVILKDESEVPKFGQTQFVLGSFQNGFELPLAKVVFISETELFNNKKKQKPKKRQKLSNAERIQSYSELKVGDYVVHVNHGIARYVGMETLDINGVHKDYLLLMYQGDDKLFIPVEQLELVQKYVGSEGKAPKLNKLGGTEWKRVKTRVQASVQDIADDLIKLYAEREAERGYGFSPDGEMMREFEDAFPYQATEDQLRSIMEIKKDMERERPMDRLLVGDVGYGKTEVALRAAFKAMMDGKQVAFLVPTTILAQQHYETMKERFQGFPIEVGLLSRFRTRKQQNETLKGLKSGHVDIVVGTHRLLSKDVEYHDLGFLIIDEEQRFGVTHKEKIKHIRSKIDVLTLTATPIPRTLHMSMLGVRDLSVIETPPANRFPVQTYVVEQNNVLIREAIERELARDGQVFFLHNRVDSILQKADEIKMLVPDARIAVAHGQMTETELESVILSFLEGEFDVLVTTTIIETGVDIPNVNTLFVQNADHMGLSQLYQLRGRVGRWNRIAYAYFMYQKDKILREEAEKRLQAIKEFTELGSGFKIAMRDLSIRGAGNILGSQQHGFIDSVGFDLYSQMLQEAIAARQPKEEHEKIVPVEIDITVDAYIPEHYIQDGRQKIEMYKRFRTVLDMDDLEELRSDMMDRFGDYPEQVEYLFMITELKVYAMRVGIESIKQDAEKITIQFSEGGTQNMRGDMVMQVIGEYGRQIGVGMDGQQLRITVNVSKKPLQEWLFDLKTLTDKLSEAKKEVSESSAE